MLLFLLAGKKIHHIYTDTNYVHTLAVRSLFFFVVFFFLFFYFAVSLTKINTSYTPTNGTYNPLVYTAKLRIRMPAYHTNLDSKFDFCTTFAGSNWLPDHINTTFSIKILNSLWILHYGV